MDRKCTNIKILEKLTPKEIDKIGSVIVVHFIVTKNNYYDKNL